MEEKDNKIKFAFAAINPYVVSNIPSAKVEENKGTEFAIWGTQNRYPQYVYGLSQEVTLLRTIINGIGDYVVGSNIVMNYAPWALQVNGLGETVEDLVKSLAQDYARYNGFALNVIRNKRGGIAEIHYIDFKNLRSDKKGEFFFYSEDWDKSYGRVKATKYPKFRPESTEYSSIYYYKNNRNSVYPTTPIDGDAAVAAETAKAIQRYHLNSIKNGFSSSAIINFNNGIPDDPTKEEVEKNLNEKFAGEENAGRLMVAFNNGKDNEVTVAKLDVENFKERYEELAKSCKQELYSAYRAQPILFGLPAENLGFNSQDISEAWKLFNTTVILPIQKVIKSAFEKILGQKEVITIDPFDIDFSEDANTELVK